MRIKVLRVRVHVARNPVVGAVEDEVGGAETVRRFLGDRQRRQRLGQLLLRRELRGHRQPVRVLAAFQLRRRLKVGLGRSRERCR